MPSTSPPQRALMSLRPLRQVLVLSLLMLGLPLLTPTLPEASAASAAETCMQPGLYCTSWTPASGPVGTKVTITGRNWSAGYTGKRTQLAWGFAPNTVVGAITVTSSGTFSTSITVPQGAPVGKTSIQLEGDFTVGRDLDFEVTGAAAPSETLPGPRFQSPKDGQTLYLEDPWIFKVDPVNGATGYLWGFFEDGKMIWENYRDERKLSGTEYDIRPGTPAYKAFAKGDVQVWVRGLVDGKWTEATIITIHVQPKASPTKPTPTPVPTPAKPKPAEQCPAVYFIGVRGSGEEPGFGETVGAHESQLATLVQGRFGKSAFDSVAVEYPASAVDSNYSRVFYDNSWRKGVSSLMDELKSQYAACAKSKEVFAIAGYSQGAMVVNSALQVLANSPTDKKILSRIATVSLYGDPRRQNAGGKLAWEVGESDSKYEGAAVFLWFQTSYQVGYPAFTKDPLGAPSRLASYCNGPDNNGNPADPICAVPRKATLEEAEDLLGNQHQTHLTYSQTYVPRAVKTASGQIRRAICGSQTC